VIRCPRLLFLILALVPLAVPAAAVQRDANSTPSSTPISVYSQDSGQSSSPIDERQALRDLDDLARLKKSGVHTEFDMMDASWFAPESGYRTLRVAGWPNGPDAWLAKCRAAGIRPGLRIDGNAIPTETPSDRVPPAWKDSLSDDGHSLSLFEGGYLADLLAALDSWYSRGVRLFLFDAVDLGAATPAADAKLSHNEIVSRNTAALREALAAFHGKNREATLVVTVEHGAQSLPQAPEADASPNQLGALTLVATGGSQGFTASAGVGSQAPNWKDAFLLSMARGGWVNSIHGDLSLIQNGDARWMARAQRLFQEIENQGRLRSFGASAGSNEPYGFAASSARGSVYVVVNPGDATATLALPAPESSTRPGATRTSPFSPSSPSSRTAGRLQFSDAGFAARLGGNSITLGPGQVAMVGYGAYAASAFDLGVEENAATARRVEPVDAHFYYTDSGSLVASFQPPIEGVVRLILRPRAAEGNAAAAQGAAHAREAQGYSLDVTQSGRPIPVRIEASSQLARNLGWTIGEVDVNDLTPGVPLVVQFHSNSNDLASLEASAYAVEY